MMCEKELLVGYLYDEIESGDRRTLEAHLAACGDCRAELKQLRATRLQLADWAPPEPELAFQIVRGGVMPRPAAPRFRLNPAWGLAAAAVLVLAAAASIANLEVKYGADGFTVRTGWGRTVAPASPQSPVLPAAASGVDDVKAQLQAISQRLRDLEAASSARAASMPVRAANVQAAGPDVIRQVQRIVAESEERQQQQLAIRVGQVNRDVDLKLRGYADYFQRGLQQVQGLTDTTILRQREMENHLSRVVLQQPK